MNFKNYEWELLDGSNKDFYINLDYEDNQILVAVDENGLADANFDDAQDLNDDEITEFINAFQELLTPEFYKKIKRTPIGIYYRDEEQYKNLANHHCYYATWRNCTDCLSPCKETTVNIDGYKLDVVLFNDGNSLISYNSFKEDVYANAIAKELKENANYYLKKLFN